MCNVFPEVRAQEAETSASAKKTWLSELPQALSTGAFLPVMCIKKKVQLTFVPLLTAGYLGLAFWWLPYFLPLVCFKKKCAGNSSISCLMTIILLMQKWSFEKFVPPNRTAVRGGAGTDALCPSLLMYCWKSSFQPKFLTSCLLLTLSKPFNFVLSGGFYLWVRTWFPWKLAR